MVRISILIIIFALSVGLSTACDHVSQPPITGSSTSVEQAFAQHDRDIQVEGEGIVTRILSDDTLGSPHQRFIVRLQSGQTVLIHHNMELAPRIDDLKEGDSIKFFGEYIWNEQGGLIHLTHHDPAGRHRAGWIKHLGRVYQ